MTTIPLSDIARVLLSVMDAIIVTYDNLDMILHHISVLMYYHLNLIKSRLVAIMIRFFN